MEADEAQLSQVYYYFNQLITQFEDNPVVRAKVEKRWTFIKKDVHGLGFILTPKFASSDDYIAREKAAVMNSVKAFALRRDPQNPQQAEATLQEMVRYVHDIKTLTGDEKALIEGMSSRDYGDIFGKKRSSKF